MSQFKHSPQAQGIDVLREPMTSILRHRNFDLAAVDYIDRVIEWRRRLGHFNRIGTNLGFHVINYVVYLHFAAQRGRVEHGATFTNLLRICEARGNCGSRALRSVLTVMVLLGRFKTGRAEKDRRVQVYVPSEALMQEVREIYGFSLGVLDQLLASADYARRMQTEPEFIATLISGSGRAIIEEDVRITEYLPDLHEIITMTGGLPTSISLAAACMRNQSCPAPQQIATEFKLTRSQVRNVVATIAEKGLITRDASYSILDASPLVEAHKLLIARELALHFKFGLQLESSLLV